MARRIENECAYCAEEISPENQIIGPDWKIYCSSACAESKESIGSVGKEQLRFIEQLLNLPGIEVLNAEIDAREIVIQIENRADYVACHKCGKRATEFCCYDETLRLRHLPVFSRRVFLDLRTKRFRCLHCEDHPTTTQRLLFPRSTPA